MRDALNDLILREPFEPFRIVLVNGTRHDIFDPQTLALLKELVHIMFFDQNWVIFPFDKIASLESLIDDYQGKEAEPRE